MFGYPEVTAPETQPGRHGDYFHPKIFGATIWLVPSIHNKEAFMVQARIVRLEGGAPRPKEKKVAESKDLTIKLAIRLNETINDVLRTMIRYRGDLSNMANEALNAVDLSEVKMISIEEKMVRDTTITIPKTLHKKLKKLADDRNSSMNVLVNTAMAHWLAGKGEIKLR